VSPVGIKTGFFPEFVRGFAAFYPIRNTGNAAGR